MRDAIRQAVSEAGQPETLARRFTAWIEAVTSGNEDIHDQEAAFRRLEDIYAQTVVMEDTD